MSWTFRKLERRTTDVSRQGWTALADDDAKSFSGKALTTLNALKYSVLYSGVTQIADAISQLKPYAITQDELTDETTRVITPRWVMSPHPELKRHQVYHQLVMSACMHGDGFGLIARRPSDGVPIGMVPLDHASVQCQWDISRAGGMTYRQYFLSGSNTPLDGTDIFHLMGPSLPGYPTGLSIIRQAREAISLGLTLEEFGARYFSQGSLAKVVLTVPGNLGDDKAKEMVSLWERFHRGPTNWHRPAIASNGATVQNISVPPEDAQFLESREFQALDVARWLRFPPHRVGIISKQSSWGSGLAEENTALHQMTYRPWIVRMESELTANAPYGEDRGTLIRLDDAGLQRGSFKEQVSTWASAYTGGLATRNEARRGVGLTAVAGGDDFVKAAAPAPAAVSNVDTQMLDANGQPMMKNGGTVA